MRGTPGFGLMGTSCSLQLCTCSKGLCPPQAILQGGRRSTKDMWEGRRCCSVHHGLGGYSTRISALSKITCSPVCGAGAGQGFPPCPQLHRCPSKVMDHSGTPVLQPAWPGGAWLLKAHGMLMGHACCGLSPRQDRLSVVQRLWDF